MSVYSSCPKCGEVQIGSVIFECRRCAEEYCEKCGMQEDACPECWKDDHVHLVGTMQSPSADIPFELAFPGDDPDAEACRSAKRDAIARQPAPMRIK